MKSEYAHDAMGNAVMYSDVMASCRDLARLGYLYLRGGTWAEGVQVISSEWIAESITPEHAAQCCIRLLVVAQPRRALDPAVGAAA